MTDSSPIAWSIALLLGAATAGAAPELAYVEAGQGEPIVFVHGGLQDYRLCESHLPAFSSNYRAIAYSRRNHYPNPTSIDALPDAAADLHAADLAAFVKSLRAA